MFTYCVFTFLVAGNKFHSYVASSIDFFFLVCVCVCVCVRARARACVLAWNFLRNFVYIVYDVRLLNFIYIVYDVHK